MRIKLNKKIEKVNVKDYQDYFDQVADKLDFDCVIENDDEIVYSNPNLKSSKSFESKILMYFVLDHSVEYAVRKIKEKYYAFVD